jgi:hypothetical protein
MLAKTNDEEEKETNHSAERDQTDESIWREQTQAHDDRILQSLKTILLLTRIHQEQKDGRRWRGSSQSVFDRGAVGVELGRDVMIVDVLVVRWKSVSLKTERANPKTSPDIDLAAVLSAIARWAEVGD